MNKLTLIILFLCFLCIPLKGGAHAKYDGFDDDQGIEIVVNGDKVIVQSLPHEGIVDVFNVLGAKVASFTVSGGIANARINLPKGYYILKSDSVTKKIVVK